ncbi:extracellular solute-binding protein [Hamadaea tsunoensis]|uniref:extracellular solute-binding protein n=1 Tax=Hamadaea tsunoensis TaxID=53368 RepID=UPI0004225FCE|nr:extracellular solute-binding protein [Hamadaea tsunoensis]
MHNPLSTVSTDRRGFLNLVKVGVVATAGAGILAGCSEKKSNQGSVETGDDALLPTYKKVELVKADVPGVPPIADGFNKYPSNLVQAVSEVPGKSGTKATAMVPFWGPTPPGLGSNQYYDAVNAALGVPLDFSVQDGTIYGQKLSAMLGARDVPDLLCVPSWEYPKIPNFADQVNALFEDLTPYLQGANASKYPFLAGLASDQWKYAIWKGKLASVPWPTDQTPYPLALFYRKDLLDAAGLAAPTSIEALHDVLKKVNDPAKGVYAANEIFSMVQMYFKVPGSQGGWRKKSDGGLEFKYETAEYKAALEFMTQLFAEKLIHPDVVAAAKTADAKSLFSGGKIIFMQDGPGAWQGMQKDQSKVTPAFNMQPVANFSASGGDPLQWNSLAPIFHTFIKKGLGKDRIEELLRVLNWLAAPFGTKEWELRQYGKEGVHFTRGADGAPVGNALAQKEIAFQYGFIVGRNPAVVGDPATPNYVNDLINWANVGAKQLETDPWVGLKLEEPATYAKNKEVYEDKFRDVLRGRRPVADLDAIVTEWKKDGGEEARTFFAKALSDNGR